MIKAFIIAAVTADGFIAKDAAHSAIWTSKEDKARFVELTKRAGVVIMGSTTFKTLSRPLQDRLNIVYTRKPPEAGVSVRPDFEKVEYTQADPKDLLADLEARGIKEVAICGGSQIYTSFMKARVVDRVFLTIEPLFFGQGITLFNEPLNHHLKPVGAKVNEATGTLLLEYKVEYHGDL
ncbi:MAG: dihydrofolate reductase family protein [Patescibacteria group bacterium]